MRNKKILLFAAALVLLGALAGFSSMVFASGSASSIGETPVPLAVLAATTAENSTAGGQQAVFTNGVFRITTAGRYILSGQQQGQVLIEATRNDVVELVLDNVTLHNPNGPAIYAPRSRRVELILPTGTNNTISDGRHPNDETNAVIFIQHDLIISGNGVLNVEGNFHHGIRSQDFLTINSGIINVRAAGDALRGRDGVIIEGGEFALTAGGDGIQANNDANPDYGYITINNGTFTINAADDGIQAESAVTINNGSLTITARDDGITTHGSVLITGGVIRITDSYEGIEGLNVTITGGDITVSARDDGINARDPSIPNTRGRFMGGRTAPNPNMYVRITGGNINVQARGDGIDSNNNIFLEGGKLMVSGPSLGMEGAIDFDGEFIITGGELITAGSVIGVSRQSTQPSLLYGYGRQQPSGALIEVRDSRGNVLLSYTAQNAFTMSGFTCPSFVSGQTYSLYVNREKVADLTLNGLITSIGNNAGGGFGGRGGGGNRGGFGGQDMNPPPRPRFL